MIVHIYTSAKGGVGKTLCAISTATKYLQAGQKVLCIDLNWENADLAKIMRLSESKRVGNKFDYTRLTGGNGLVLEPTIPFLIVPGSIGFWKLLNAALDEAKRLHRFTADIAIIDTGMHFCNLIRQDTADTTERGLKKINEIAQVHEFSNLHIWFLWTLAAIHGKRDHITQIQKTLFLLGNGLDGTYFHEKNNFIHVFNPYALFPVFKMIKVALNGVRAIMDKDFSQSEILNNMQEVANSGIMDGIRFEILVTQIFDKVISKIGNRPANASGFLDFFAKEVLTEFKGKRPRNLFTIPVYDQQIVGYTDLFARENPTQLKQVADDIEPILKVLSKFIDDLN